MHTKRHIFLKAMQGNCLFIKVTALKLHFNTYEKVGQNQKEFGGIMENCNVNYNINQKKQMAKVYVILGNTLKETAEKTGLSIDQIKKISAKEKLIEKREEFLKRFYAEHWETTKQNKDRRLKLNALALDGVEKEIELHGVNIKTMEKILISEEIEQKILECDRIERYERLEVLKAKYNRTK